MKFKESFCCTLFGKLFWLAIDLYSATSQQLRQNFGSVHMFGTASWLDQKLLENLDPD